MALNFNDSNKGRLSIILFAVFVVVSIVLMTVYATEGSAGPLHSAQAEFQSMVSPLKTVGEKSRIATNNAYTSLGDAIADNDTLSSLRAQNEELRQLLAQSEEYKLEAERLRALLEIKDTFSIEGVSARIIGRSTDAWSQTITIDVGAVDGVKQGLTVVGASGVVGQVISVAEGSSVVRLITDPSSGVAAMIQSNRAQGIIRGSLSGLLYLENLPSDTNVDIGDVVLTSGLGGSYTKGLLIGSIVRVNNQAGSDMRTIVVSQNIDISQIEEVIVVFSASEAKAQLSSYSNGSEDNGSDNASAPAHDAEQGDGADASSASNVNASNASNSDQAGSSGVDEGDE